MNRNLRRVPTKFEPEVGFEVSPAGPARARTLEAEQFGRLKRRLLNERLEAALQPEANSSLAAAASEAEALAWVTAYPLLVFPVLFEEKAAAAARHARRQAEVWQRSRELLAV